MITAFEYVCGALLFVISFFSLISSVATIAIIRVQNKWNGYLAIICCLSACQIVYDCSFILVDAAALNGNLFTVSTFLLTFGGMSTTIWTNVMSFIITYIVLYTRSFDIFKYFWQFVAVAVLPSLLLASAQLTYGNSDTSSIVYYWFRMGSIIANIIAYVLVSLRIRHLLRFQLDNSNRTSETYHNQNKDMDTAPRRYGHNSPLCELATRMKLYPIVQIACRAPACWYEYCYGYRDGTIYSGGNTAHAVSFWMNLLISPAAGLGFFIVFLMFQPNAYAVLRSWCVSLCCCGCLSGHTKDYSRHILAQDHRRHNNNYNNGRFHLDSSTLRAFDAEHAPEAPALTGHSHNNSHMTTTGQQLLTGDHSLEDSQVHQASLDLIPSSSLSNYQENHNNNDATSRTGSAARTESSRHGHCTGQQQEQVEKAVADMDEDELCSALDHLWRLDSRSQSSVLSSLHLPVTLQQLQQQQPPPTLSVNRPSSTARRVQQQVAAGGAGGDIAMSHSVDRISASHSHSHMILL